MLLNKRLRLFSIYLYATDLKKMVSEVQLKEVLSRIPVYVSQLLSITILS